MTRSFPRHKSGDLLKFETFQFYFGTKKSDNKVWEHIYYFLYIFYNYTQLSAMFIFFYMKKRDFKKYYQRNFPYC